MKTVKSLMIVIPAAMALTACDGWQKSPSSDLQDMRAQAKTITEMGPDKPRTVTNEVVVEKQVEKIIKETGVTSSMILLTADSEMIFKEGEAKSYSIRASLPVPGATVGLTATNLPDGASLRPSPTEKDVYVLSWNPPMYTVGSDSALKSIQIKLVATVTDAGQAKNAATLKGMVKELDKILFVTKTTIAPSSLKVSGLNAEVSEDQLTPFSIIVTVPGIDGKSTQKPRPLISYDGQATSIGKDYQELDGSRYVIADLSKKEPEYLGNSKWKFNLIFDTKNIAVQPQLAQNGSIMSQADGTRVRFTVKAFSPNGLSTPETLVQVKIVYTKTITAPRFDVSGLGKQGLEVSPGEKIVLHFSASSNNRNAVVAVETKNSVLPGNPQVSCAVSSTGNHKQDCTLTWEVPCDATSKTLKGSIDLAATSTLNGRISDVTDYSLKTLKAAKDKKLCAAPVETAAKKAAEAK
ncbi:hypothetical protein B9G69_013850 [Bdellovibrio sp. SKB1291214]|uniref:hypothetical protein n=1 Tax=Bdellovibrio sp. SKB1291214 TaxID=1732569 RepID=UPI000B51BE0E|nr:hypothetical protein [Bdellovibrio sp. SKB1291214]UYL08130.1 hypothetical protein B9G69_013850 [Bdellovibrio sp. SKB1291214]